MKKFVSFPALLIYAAAAAVTTFCIIRAKRRNKNYA